MTAPASPVQGETRSVSRFAELMQTRPLVVLAGVLVALILVTSVIEPGYLSPEGMRNTVLVAAPLALLAGAQTILMLTGGIDLSVGMIATGAAYVAGSQSPEGAAIAIGFGLLVGLLAGFGNGVGVGVFRVNPLIMTLATAAILLGLFTAWAQGFLQGSTAPAPLIRQLGAGTFLGGLIPYSALVWAVLAVGIIWMLRGTGFGRLLYAAGDNPIGVRLSGVRLWQVHIAVYTLAGLLAAVGGILLAGRTGAVDLALATGLLLPSVAASVIGGTSIFGGIGSYSGTILGALILSVLGSLLTFLQVGQALQQVVYGLIVLGLSWLYARVTGVA
jgi:ribose transport system permease protein